MGTGRSGTLLAVVWFALGTLILGPDGVAASPRKAGGTPQERNPRPMADRMVSRNTARQASPTVVGLRWARAFARPRPS